VTRNTINVLAHERLAIVDPLKGAQPLTDHSGKVVLSVNGEIWNHQQLRQQELPDYQFLTASDCEPLIPLYLKYGDEFIHKIDGIFALVIADEDNDTFFAARDAIGVMSLYMGHGADGSLWFASEMKALVGQAEQVVEFPPGHFWSSRSNGFVRWYNPHWLNPALIPDVAVDLVRLRHSLQSSVVKRLMTDVP
jgi:asparagine synthase (glutamine-hydrolysing)